ncbi:ABC transporter substrate-binding protein [Pseudoclavibacter sp. VKM Ac-2888]|uniref:ABC transporter substrate-binding protein n=1 Tax=Pseudoclavibacter sp. VKM Ac-2888 TaxID=2783830 RepID=UPI00188BD856|nr:ABC transporter substrate-binding protein [Pseudoclavibacter sp. VKM Ac-2888]MBF4548907.1 ABC transporter substrate-binding protein [Pseudoclavibacter sp. VKM Ac-2888]
MTRSTRPLSAAALAAVGMMALASCASQSGAVPAADAEPVQGGNLRVGILSDIGCIDPAQVGNNNNVNIARQTVASLTTQDVETGEVLPWLAESWEISDDAREFTFTLAEGPTFADGTPIDAEAVKANAEGVQALGAKSALGNLYLAGLESVTVVDPQTVTYTFAEPSAQFLQATSTFTLGLVSTESTKLSQEARCDGDFIGSGPFSVESYTPNAETVLAAREDYTWGASTTGNTERPYLDTITYSVIPEASTLTGSLQSGQLDVSTDVSFVDLDALKGAGANVQNRANPGVVYNLIPNASHPILSDKNVRLAVQKSINREELLALLTPEDSPATSVLATSTPYYSDQSDILEYNVEDAAKLLDEAGWVEGADGIREKDGQKLSFELAYWQPTTNVLEQVQVQLAAVGIDLQLREAPIADVTAINDGTQPFTWANITRADPDALRVFFSAEGGNKYNYREVGPIDEVLNSQAAIVDADARQTEVDAAVTQLLEEGYAVPVIQLSTNLVQAPGVQGVQFEASSRLDFSAAWKAAE